ncbi:MAG TPA: zeta toxin family protein [Pyrinomonadaceae bacterium]
MSEPRPQVVVIAGPNGAGKTTLAPFLLRDELGLSEFVNADDIARGLSAFNPQGATAQAGRIMLRRLRDLADARRSFAFETTLATRSYAAFLKRLKQKGYDFHLFFMWLRSPDLAVERVRERVRLGGHDVPEHIVRRRYVRAARNFFHLYRSLADSWVVYDNSVSGSPVRVAAGHGASALKVHDEGLWQRLSEVAK